MIKQVIFTDEAHAYIKEHVDKDRFLDLKFEDNVLILKTRQFDPEFLKPIENQEQPQIDFPVLFNKINSDLNNLKQKISQENKEKEKRKTLFKNFFLITAMLIITTIFAYTVGIINTSFDLQLSKLTLFSIGLLSGPIIFFVTTSIWDKYNDK